MTKQFGTTSRPHHKGAAIGSRTGNHRLPIHRRSPLDYNSPPMVQWTVHKYIVWHSFSQPHCGQWQCMMVTVGPRRRLATWCPRLWCQGGRSQGHSILLENVRWHAAARRQGARPSWRLLSVITVLFKDSVDEMIWPARIIWTGRHRNEFCRLHGSFDHWLAADGFCRHIWKSRLSKRTWAKQRPIRTPAYDDGERLACLACLESSVFGQAESDILCCLTADL